MKDSRDIVKSEFKYYLANVARTARRTSEGFNLGRTAVDSFLSFLEPDKLFDYNPEKWGHIESLYDITDPVLIKQIANDLLSDQSFLKHDNAKNQGWRSGAISHYVCFINARSFFMNKKIERPAVVETASNPLQQIYYGAPGTGKSHEIKMQTKGKMVIRTTFHPDSDYSTFVGAYKPTSVEEPVMTIIGKEQVLVENAKPVKKIVYEFVPQAFLKAYTGAWKNQEKPFFLIIEEINRGNCAQIFGDLFQLLDRKNGESEYPISPDEDIQKFLKTDKKYGFAALSEEQKVAIPAEILSGELLKLPKNLHIWATMNTSDQSLFPIDSAFKRRWDWKFMKIRKGKDENGNELDWKIVVKDKDKNIVKINNEDSLSWWDFIKKINEIIASMTSSADKQLGYFFCKADEKANETDEDCTIISANTFVGKVLFYLWNDVFKDYGFEDASLFRYKETIDGKETVKDLTFPDFYDEDGENVNTTRVVDFVQKVMNWKKKNEENN